MNSGPLIPVIIGPTASGKTALSLILSAMIPVEIVSADSRQIYKYLDIGTAKVSQEARQCIPHYFIDICEPDEYFSAGKFGREAREIVADITRRGKQAVVVGGSGFYIQSFLDGISDIGLSDELARDTLRERHKKIPIDALYEELVKVDPDYALKINRNDVQRISRALEVYHLTGKTFSEWHQEPGSPAKFNFFMIGLDVPRPILYERINRRVDEMIQAGLTDEVNSLLRKGFSPALNALNTVGYKEVFQYLSNEITLNNMIELIKRNSRRYAKRQMTWFRKDPRVLWKQVKSENDLKMVAEEICLRLQGKIC